MSFKRHQEDFICGHCGAEVKGNGYTNHCPVCLWSKHVDVTPGDRQESCQGLMEPIDVEVDRDKYILTHKCVICGAKKRNHTSPKDDFQVILKLSVRL